MLIITKIEYTCNLMRNPLSIKTLCQQYLFYSFDIHENAAEKVYNLDFRECQGKSKLV